MVRIDVDPTIGLVEGHLGRMEQAADSIQVADLHRHAEPSDDALHRRAEMKHAAVEPDRDTLAVGMDRLCAHVWSGNVRELENEI